MKKNLIIKTLFFLLIIVSIHSVLSLSKPVTGQILNYDAPTLLSSKIYLNVGDPLVGEQTCTIINKLNVGSDGSFTTNLNNLVLENFPLVSCSNFWKAGDDIWFEVEVDDQILSSNLLLLESGTGLQRLGEMVLEDSVPISSPGSSSGGSSSSGSSSSSSSSSSSGDVTGPSVDDQINQDRHILTPGLVDTNNVPNVKIQLTSLVEWYNLKSNVDITLLNGVSGNLLLKLVMFKIPNDEVFILLNDTFHLNGDINKDYALNLDSMGPGRYKIQAFVYHLDDLISVSNIEYLLYVKKDEPRLEEPGGNMMFMVNIILIIIIVILFIYIVKKRKLRKTRKK